MSNGGIGTTTIPSRAKSGIWTLGPTRVIEDKFTGKPPRDFLPDIPAKASNWHETDNRPTVSETRTPAVGKHPFEKY